MKKMIYSFLLSLIAFCIISCDDNNENPDISGTWEYESPYFVFDYSQDTISIAMGPRPIKIAVEDVKLKFAEMAGEKMGQYFKGVDFGTDSDLNIHMQMGDQSGSTLHAKYEQSGNYIQVELNSTEMEALTHGAVSQIPSISFNYTVTNNKLRMYFNKEYLEVVYMMMSDMLIDILITNVMHLNPENLSEENKNNIKDQIQDVLNKTIRLEIGFNLSR